MSSLNVNPIYAGYGVKIDAALIGGVTSLGLSPGTEVRGEAVSGDWLPRFKAVAGQKNTLQFTTHALAAALAACGIAGFNCATGAKLSLFAWKIVKGGTRSAAADSKKALINDGLLVPTNLNCSHGQDAQLSYSGHITWDGTNSPIIVSEAAVPAGLTDAQRFTLGAVTIGGTAIDRVQSIGLNFGIKVATEGGSSEIWDDTAAITAIEPKLTIKTRSLVGVAKLPYAAGTIANTIVQLRKRALGGGFAGSGDITIACAGTIHLSELWSASGQGIAEQTIEVDVHYDGANSIILFG